MRPTQEDIERAVSQWLNGFFSWEEKPVEGEVDCAREGFLSGVNWAFKQVDHGETKNCLVPSCPNFGNPTDTGKCRAGDSDT